MTTISLIAGLLIYVLASRFALMRMRGTWREIAFAVVNVAGMYGFLFNGQKSYYAARFVMYLALVAFQYFMLCLFAHRQDRKAWLAFFTPIAFLIIFRYIPGSVYTGMGHAVGMVWRGAPNMVGISYLAFRASHLVLEVRNGAEKKPGFWQYLGFCFFLPTIPVGPINPYSNHRRGFDEQPPRIPAGRALMRILVGAVKYQFLGGILNRLTYSGLLLDEHLHHWMDLPVAVLFYYLYLYCNFSGFCDMAIGVAGLIGIPVAENFNDPFAARNVKDFWNRWHITLSLYMRDVVFSPLSKFLVRLTGVAYADHAIALTIVVVFLIVGVWHGVGWNFAAYGAAHALGVVVNHYYTIFLKKRLGRDGFKAYNANPWIHAAAISLTFCYCAATLFLFANTFPQMREIFSELRW
jgi:D-alanyl-lipoteichoic acid acyltransferase DltB (MBOAT superfamily)